MAATESSATSAPTRGDRFWVRTAQFRGYARPVLRRQVHSRITSPLACARILRRLYCATRRLDMLHRWKPPLALAAGLVAVAVAVTPAAGHDHDHDRGGHKQSPSTTSAPSTYPTTCSR